MRSAADQRFVFRLLRFARDRRMERQYRRGYERIPEDPADVAAFERLTVQRWAAFDDDWSSEAPN
jgi:hypothetical protein